MSRRKTSKAKARTTAWKTFVLRRLGEVMGLGLVGLALLTTALLFAHGPSGAGEARGALIASSVYHILGVGSWGIPIMLAMAGVHLVIHTPLAQARRLVFFPIAVALASTQAATSPPDAGWPLAFGMGGLLGDTIFAMVLQITNITSYGAIKIITVVFTLGAWALAIFSSGIKRDTLVDFIDYLQDSTAAFCHAMACLALAVLKLLWTATCSLLQRIWVGLCSLAGLKEMIPELNFSMPKFPERAAPLFGNEDPSERADRREPVVSRPQPAAARTEPPLMASRSEAPRPMFNLQERMRELDPLTDEDEDDADEDCVIEAFEEVPEIAPSGIVHPRGTAPTMEPTPRAPAPQTPVSARPSPKPIPKRASNVSILPSLELLEPAPRVQVSTVGDAELEDSARVLEGILEDYGVKGEIVSVRPGPVVTMYELEPAPGLKASRVIGLSDDIARSMSALSARVSTVPGRSVIGIELPNEVREKVVLREILSRKEFSDGKHKLPLALGKDIGGEPIVANLAKMPHLLIAGTTGSGKSVAINTMILSLLYKLSPEECRMIMIDPKMLELSVYDGIPHLLTPVVTDPKKAVVALKWVVGEMEERYRKMSKMGVRNIDGYNGRVEDALAKDESFSRTVQTGFDDETGEPVFETEEFAPEKMPYIVVIVDEMADLMMVAGKEIEACIQRLAQMARASGIHLIMATQRPSVDVITGTIKANFPTRISFSVTSKIDSRTILGEQGAEQLLGMGDMLYMAGGGRVTRVHGPFVSDEEVEDIVRHLKAFGPPEYIGSVLEGPAGDKESDIDAVLGLGGNTDGEDAVYDQAVAIVIKDRKCSTSYIQRKMAIGYNKAARLVEQMEEQGVVSAANHVGKREILVGESAN
jgi:DNA segregation ATPase FtsK/SpoIIIE, S-DNA-T family